MKTIISAALGACLLAGCSSHTDSTPAASSITASNVTLTAAQRQNIHLYTVEASKIHKTVDTTGTVDFDEDLATTILRDLNATILACLGIDHERLTYKYLGLAFLIAANTTLVVSIRLKIIHQYLKRLSERIPDRTFKILTSL